MSDKKPKGFIKIVALLAARKEPMLDLEQIVSPPEVPPERFRMDYYVPIAGKI